MPSIFLKKVLVYACDARIRMHENMRTHVFMHAGARKCTRVRIFMRTRARFRVRTREFGTILSVSRT